MTSYQERKRQFWESRKQTIEKNIDSLTTQINSTSNFAELNNLNIQIEEYFKQLAEVENQLSKLGNSSLNYHQESNIFERNLSKIDFEEARKIIDSILHKFKAQARGGAALFLLQESLSMRGDLCMAEMREQLREYCSHFKHCPVDLSARNQLTSKQELLDAIAHYFNPIEPVSDETEYAQAIVDKIGSTLQGGSVVFIELNTSDDWLSAEHLLSWFVNAFWLPLTQLHKSIASQFPNVRFVVVISVEEPLSEECQKLPCFWREDDFDCQKIVNLPLYPWTEEHIQSWLSTFSGLSVAQIAREARKIYRASRAGIPEIVCNRLQKLMNSAR
ncbi:MAG: hypothetical protein AB4426_13725 [Xenococcaceae cyanobacterium]